MGDSKSVDRGLDRRTFLRDTGLVTLGLGLGALPTGRVGANDMVNIGLIGCNGMGFANTRSTLNVPGTRCIALCDVDQNVLERRTGELVELYGEQPRVYSDYRELLDDPDVDAVIIATPDHWHCLQMVRACEAGKDVYVEKPLANSIVECERMVAAQEASGSVVQVGQWQRSGLHWIEAMEFVRSGQLGKIRTVKAWMYNGGIRPLPVRPDGPAPDGVDYDMWLGPAPLRPYNRNRYHGSFRWFWDYAGGLMTDWGVHLIDPVLWGMQVEYPKRVMSTGGNFGFPETAMETPDTQHAIYEFDDFTMVWEHTMGAGLSVRSSGPTALHSSGETARSLSTGTNGRSIRKRSGDQTVRPVTGWQGNRYGRPARKTGAWTTIRPISSIACGLAKSLPAMSGREALPQSMLTWATSRCARATRSTGMPRR